MRLRVPESMIPPSHSHIKTWVYVIHQKSSNPWDPHVFFSRPLVKCGHVFFFTTSVACD